MGAAVQRKRTKPRCSHKSQEAEAYGARILAKLTHIGQSAACDTSARPVHLSPLTFPWGRSSRNCSPLSPRLLRIYGISRAHPPRLQLQSWQGLARRLVRPAGGRPRDPSIPAHTAAYARNYHCRPERASG